MKELVKQEQHQEVDSIPLDCPPRLIGQVRELFASERQSKHFISLALELIHPDNHVLWKCLMGVQESGFVANYKQSGKVLTLMALHPRWQASYPDLWATVKAEEKIADLTERPESDARIRQLLHEARASAAAQGLNIAYAPAGQYHNDAQYAERAGIPAKYHSLLAGRFALFCPDDLVNNQLSLNLNVFEMVHPFTQSLQLAIQRALSTVIIETPVKSRYAVSGNMRFLLLNLCLQPEGFTPEWMCSRFSNYLGNVPSDEPWENESVRDNLRVTMANLRDQLELFNLTVRHPERANFGVWQLTHTPI